MTQDQNLKSQDSQKEGDSSESAPPGQVLVILKTKAHSLKSTESFLKNRGWTIYSTPQLKEALAFIIQKKPEYVLIAADHPNKKVKILPRLLNQAFSMRIIGFADSEKGNIVTLLQEMGLEYNLYSPVSGPAVERMVLKIQKDSENRQQSSEQKLSALRAAPGAEESTLVDGNVLDSAKTALQRLLSEGDSETSVSDSDPTTDSSQNRTEDSDLRRSDDPGIIIQKGTRGELINYNPNATGESGGMYNPSVPIGSGAGGGSPQDAGAYVQQSQIQSTGASSSGMGSLVDHHEKSSLGKVISQEKKQARSQVRAFGNEDSIFVRGTQTALEESIQVIPELPEEEISGLNLASNMACLTIESVKFSGYLVAAMGDDRVIDQEFMMLIKTRLFAFLRNHGENLNEQENPMNIRVEQVQFQEWALHQAEFLRKSIHGKDEIAVAFFPSKETKLHLEKSTAENMLKIKIDEIKEDTVLEFDLYIYMPENQKFLLYTPEGQVFQGKQKARLVKKGITHMHLQRDKIEDVKRYKVRVFLDQQITEFKKTKGSES